MKTLNLLISGVGGQGILLAGRVLGALAALEGLDCKASEVHGMAQRGGSVITHVRMGEKVYSPLIEKGCGDILVAFEPLEALRYAQYVRPGGAVVVNTRRIAPMGVLQGTDAYPENPLAPLEGAMEIICLDALELAQSCGNPRGVNLVLLGTLSTRLPFSEASWHTAIAQCVPPKTLEGNLRAFALGLAW